MTSSAQSSCRPVTVCSTSSLDSEAHDCRPVSSPSLPEPSDNIISSSTLSSIIPSPTLSSAVPDHEVPSSNVAEASESSTGPSGMLLSPPVPIVPNQLPAAPVVAAPAPPAPNNNTVAEFLYQLTKMLTDNNKEVIEWANGQIKVHDPHRLEREVMHKYFRHSKFASFQRQLNYFGFRKLAGKGKMSPCSYVNEAATSDLRSLLLIKRKSSVTTPRDKTSRKRGRSGSSSASASSSATAPVNPVLAGILHRNTSSPRGKRSKSGPTPVTTAQLSKGKGIKHNVVKTLPSVPASSSQQALAQAAIGKGVRHGLSPSKKQNSATAALESLAFPDPPQLDVLDIHDSLSQLTSNYRNSLQGDETEATAVETDGDPSFRMYNFLSRDSSLVDLAMLVPVPAPSEQPAVEPPSQQQEEAPVLDPNAAVMPFVDFPIDPPIENDESEKTL